jgi:hypothetical protein
MNVTSGGKKLRADSSDYSLHVAGPQLWALGLLSRVRGPWSLEPLEMQKLQGNSAFKFSLSTRLLFRVRTIDGD